jgi:hypothetical protein
MAMGRMGHLAGIQGGDVNLEVFERGSGRRDDGAHGADFCGLVSKGVPIEDGRVHDLNIGMDWGGAESEATSQCGGDGGDEGSKESELEFSAGD